MNNLVLAAAMAVDLPARRGEVMLLADLANELHLSENALRLLLSRGGDVPRPAELPGKGHRWLTRDVAVWLAEHSTARDALAGGDRPDAGTDGIAQPRRPGRPRKTQQLRGAAGGEP